MIDSTIELIQNLTSRLTILDNAYVAGNYRQTLTNLNIDISNMNDHDIQSEYQKVVLEIHNTIVQLDNLSQSIAYA
jgi:hypothetical protein